MIFEDADATGLGEDARLTAMWLWTLSIGGSASADQEEGEEEKQKSSTGFVLEFDAARKIAQGLGAHLEGLQHVVEVKGDKARLLPVNERARHLFGKEQEQIGKPKKKARKKQMALFAVLEEAEKAGAFGELGVPPAGETTLDQVHQAMILFGAGRAEAMKRFLVDENVGTDGKFWKLAQSLSALYPPGTEEKRWVDGVLARKKGLGF